MRIEELILDGFKSYPVRTQITGWDSSFNAITGLNGSGKSNILDAICFVLGITNMTQLRAQNQLDLIYKRGQAGNITKASVTVVFDNTDPMQRPEGHPESQITVTRQVSTNAAGNKYLVNGHKTSQEKVHQMFQSVQLNINNPNFLIMQGRITKVLNMKPPEILGMIEEAAGTRMFEEGKEKAKRTMEKKDKRVTEITAQVAEEITPKLEKLRAEKRSFMQYQKTTTELELVDRTMTAYEWTEANARIERKQKEIDNIISEIAKQGNNKLKWKRESDSAEREKMEVKKKQDAEMKKGGKLEKLEKQAAEIAKELSKIRTQGDIKSGTIKDEKAKVSALESELQELNTSFVAKRGKVEAQKAEYTEIKDKHTESEKALKSAEDLLQTLQTGLTSTGAGTSSGGGYMGQLADAKARQTQAVAEEKQERVKLNMHEKDLKELETRWKQVEREAGDGKRNLDVMLGERDQLRAKLQALSWNTDQEESADNAMKEAKTLLRRCSDERDSARRQAGNVDINYDHGATRVDLSGVRGLLMTLMDLEPENYDKATALEVTAGGKLKNIVVNNKDVGTNLLKPGVLRSRAVIIPLDKVQGHKLPQNTINDAQRISEGKAQLALNLVRYEPAVQPAMNFVFGNTFICKDTETAKKVTFGNLRVRSVTLQGDVYDPSGSLSGGAAPSGGGTLVRMQAWNKAEKELQLAKAALDRLEHIAAQNAGVREQWNKLVRELEMKEHEVSLLEKRVGGSSASRIGVQIAELTKTISNLKVAIKAAKDKQTAAEQECTKLERDMEEFKTNKDGKIDELKASISKQKKDIQKKSVSVTTKRKDLQTAKAELEAMEADIEASKAALEEAREGIVDLQAELDDLLENVTQTEAEHTAVEVKMKQEKATLKTFDDEIDRLDAVKAGKKKLMDDADIEVNKLDHQKTKLTNDRVNAEKSVAHLEETHPWIEEDKHEFGTQGGPYEFGDADAMKGLRDKRTELHETQKGLKKNGVNQKVMTMIDNVEKKDASLKKMLATVMKDKQKIEETIEELDRLKRDALQKTWDKVNGDFGDIFGELLPGNTAKLQPQEGKDLMEGLEVKVQLGTVWKESLTELSGGQRSLIALSLIMSLLQFKPAPMYILDEIDAALDLSHTQHIGQLFRTRFKGSQFIVVSLKDGLFANANVLFRTKFRDGTSIVEQTVQRSNSNIYD